jgi:hypothetical protein
MPLAVPHNMGDLADQAFLTFEKAILGKMQTPGVRAVSLQRLDPGADVISGQCAGNDEPRRTSLFQIGPASMLRKGRFEHGISTRSPPAHGEALLARCHQGLGLGLGISHALC